MRRPAVGMVLAGSLMVTVVAAGGSAAAGARHRASVRPPATQLQRLTKPAGPALTHATRAARLRTSGLYRAVVQIGGRPALDHHADGVSYPVVADPQVQTTPSSGQTVASTKSASLPTWQNSYDWTLASPHGYFGWNSKTSNTDPGAYSFARGLPAGAGLWVWPTGGRTYSPGYANWAYRAPGTTRALTATVTLSYPPRLLSHHCVAIVLRDKNGAERNASRFCKPPQPPKGNPATVTLSIADSTPSAPSSTELTVGLELPCTKSNPSACNKNIPSADATKDGLRVLKVDMTLVDDDPPIPAPSGEWYDLDDKYVNGKKTNHALTLAASDAGSGIKRVAVEEIARGEIASANAPCDPTHKTTALDNRICPASFSAPTTIDATKLAEGKHLFRETAQDVAANLGASAPWAVLVDRTPPPTPTDFIVDTFDPQLGAATIAWDPGSDPVLADGSPGSGLARAEVRYQLPNVPWSDWRAAASMSDDDLRGVSEGELVNVQVRTYDAVENVSSTATATLVIGDAPSVNDGTGPAAVAGGTFAAREGDFVGAGSLPMLIGGDASDSAGGVASVSATDGPTTLGTVHPDCTNGCPATYSEPILIDTRALPEGRTTVTVTATDPADNTGDRDKTTVYVDRTGPDAPTNFAFEPFNGGSATLSWDPGDDPTLPDGSQGSGDAGTEYRLLVNGAWTNWTRDHDGFADIDGLTAGQQVTVEGREVDGSGNRSTKTSTVLTLTAPAAQARTAVTASAAAGFDTCTPNIHFARSRENNSDFRHFKEKTNSLGAELSIYCTINNTQSVSLTGQFAISAGGSTFRLLSNGRADLGEHPVKNRVQTFVRGVTFDCANYRAEMDGTNNYIVLGKITLHREDASDITLDYNTDFNHPAHLWCPDADSRQDRVESGWRVLSRLSPDVSDSQERSASRQLGRQLHENEPYKPADTKLAWAAHHIVPYNDPRAKSLFVALWRCGIHPNSDTNGVWLRGSGLKEGLLLFPWVGECPVHRGSGGHRPLRESIARAIRASGL